MTTPLFLLRSEAALLSTLIGAGPWTERFGINFFLDEDWAGCGDRSRSLPIVDFWLGAGDR